MTTEEVVESEVEVAEPAVEVEAATEAAFSAEADEDDTDAVDDDAIAGSVSAHAFPKSDLPPPFLDLDEGLYNCLMEGTPVVRADGSTVLIEDLVRRQQRVDVLAWTPEKGIHAARVVGWYRQRVPGQTWLRVQLENQRANAAGLRLTPDHKIYVAGQSAPVRADELMVSDAPVAVLLPEVAWTDYQRNVVLGLMLGDSRAVASAAYRRRWAAAPTFALSGGFVAESGFSEHASTLLAPHVVLDPIHPEGSIVIRGRVARQRRFQPFRTNNLTQLVPLVRQLYDDQGQRRIAPDLLATLAPEALAWWFISDGCRQNGQRSRHMHPGVRGGKVFAPDTVTLAVCRYKNDAAYILRAFRARFGKVTLGKDGVLRFSRAATEKFCALIAPHVIPPARYKFPRDLRLPDYVLQQPSEVQQPVKAVVHSITEYTPKRKTAGDRLQAETRFCITVEGAGNFFTSFGLVKNCRDVLGMCRIYQSLASALERTNSLSVYAADRQMAFLASQMTKTGMPIDVAERDKLGDKLRKVRDEAAEDLRPFTEGENRNLFVDWVAMFSATKARKGEPQAGDMNSTTGTVHSSESAFLVRQAIRKNAFLEILAKKGVNFGAKIQQAAILRVAGVPLTKLTLKTGMPQVSKDTLEEFGYHAAARSMLNWMLTSAAIKNVIEGYDLGPDNRVHAQWMVHKITGRWGSSPNMQNVSKRAGGGRVNMRSMFVAPEGYVFVGADFAQLEARIIAAASQDAFLLEIFRTDQDIHGALAGVAFPSVWPKLAQTFAEHKGRACGPNPADAKSKCDFCKQRDKLRDLTKRLEYGAFYGGAAETLWKSCVKDFPDLKIQQINEFLRVVGQRMSGVIRWRASVLAQAEKSFEIRSPILGRRETFPLGRVEPTVAYNYIPQSGGADLWALGAIDFMERWDQFGSEDARICHNGHDSILVLCKEQYADRVKLDVEQCWTRAWNGVTFKIEAEIGKRWSDV